MVLLSGKGKPLVCRFKALLNAFAQIVAQAQIILGLVISLFCRQSIILCRLHLILLNAAPVVIAYAQTVDGREVSLLRGEKKIPDGFLIILFDAFAFIISVSDVKELLRIGDCRLLCHGSAAEKNEKKKRDTPFFHSQNLLN